MTQSLITSAYPVTLDYSRTLLQMIEAGEYDSVDSDITTEHFPTTGTGTQSLEIVLVYFDKEMQSEDVLSELDTLGLRAASLPELLAFGQTHPDIQRQFPIIALGSIWRDRRSDRRVPYLSGWNGRRGLFSSWFVHGWHDDCCFAAVRK